MANTLSKRSATHSSLTDLNQLVNRALEPNWFGEEGGLQNVLVTSWIPRINIKNEPKQFVIHADVPGVELKDIDINVQDGMLTIQGKKETNIEKRTDAYVRIERSTGSFYRSISLPESIDADKIKAKAKNGVLEIIAPKAKKKAAKKIRVQ